MDTKKQTHILVIRLSAMGDVAMTVPVLKAVLREHSSVKITVLTKPFMAPIYSDIKGVSVHMALVKDKHKGVFGIYKLFKELKALQITAVADLHNVLRSKILIIFFRLAGIKVVQIDKGRAEKKALTRWENKVLSPLKTTHQRYIKVFSDLGFTTNLKSTDILDKKELSKSILAKVKDPDCIGIAPFAAFKGKMYPLSLMEEVIASLSKKNSVVLFGGGPKEKALLEEIASKYEQVINMAGVLSFKDELSLISNLRLMIAMDSGNAHLAAMYGVPTITLWGLTHPYAGFAPFAMPDHYSLLSDLEKFPLIPTSVYGNKFPEGYLNVMNTILPTTVVKKVETVLEKA